MIIAGASPGETKMWAAVRENGDFFCTCGSNNWESVEYRSVHCLASVALPMALYKYVHDII